MSNSTQNRLSTTYSVDFPDYPSLKLSPHHVRVHQSAGLNDVIEMFFGPSNPLYYKGLKTGVPVRFNWKTNKASGEFVGYVTDVTVPTQSTKIRYTVVRGVGAGFVLKGNASKVWVNKTPSEIVKEVATKYGLKPCITPDAFRYSQQSLNGLTYWQKVQELATRSGFVAQIYGATLHYHPIDKMVDEFITTIPFLSFFESENNPGMSDSSQTLDQFRPRVGDMVDIGEHLRTDKTVSGINPLTGKLFTSTSSPTGFKPTIRKNASDSVFTRVMPGVVAETQEAAKTLSNAQARLAQFSISSDGMAQGDPRISPYKTVEIDGTGSVTDGFWVVTKATHFMSFDGKYTVDFSCVTDGIGNNKPSVMRPSAVGGVPTRNLQYETAVAGNKKPYSVKLKSSELLIQQTAGGFNRTPRRWIGK